MSSSRQGSRVSSVSSSPPLRVRWSATGEVAHFVEFVAKEFEAHGGSCGGREDVDNAAAYSVFAALGNQVYAGVCGVVETAHHILEGVFFAANQVHGFKFFDAGDDGLDDRAYGCDNDLGGV